MTITVTDSGTPQLTDSETIQITVNEVNQNPELGAIGDRTVNEGETLTFTIDATDADLPAQTLTFSKVSGPEGLSVSATGQLTWTPTEAQGPSTNTVTVRVSDGVANADRSFTVVVNEVNEAPVLAAVPDQTINEGTLKLSGSATLHGGTQNLIIRQSGTLDLNGITPNNVGSLFGAGTITNSAGATDRAFGLLSKTFAHQYDLLKNRFELLLISIGERILPRLQAAFESLATTVEGNQERIASAVAAPAAFFAIEKVPCLRAAKRIFRPAEKPAGKFRMAFRH